MIALIERLKIATGADRELDRDISRELEEKVTTPFVGPSAWDMHKGMYWVIGSEDTKDGPVEKKWGKTAPRYTSSLDAALTLVPVDTEQWDICMDTYPIACVGRGENGAKGANPAIALCIAALKARG